MTIGALGYGGMNALWQQSQHMMNTAARGAAETAPIPAQSDELPATTGASAVGAGAAVGAAGAALAPSELPYVPEGYGPEELATRLRLQFPGLGAPPEKGVDGQLQLSEKDGEGEDGVSGVDDAKSAAEVMEEGKCETCAKRKYQDGSDDPGVSFKTATRVDPKAAQAAVRGHEMEHVVRERAKAEREDRKVVSQSVTYHTGICPECGKFYISGGTTRTVTAADNSKDFLRKRFADKGGDEGLDVTA